MRDWNTDPTIGAWNPDPETLPNLADRRGAGYVATLTCARELTRAHIHPEDVGREHLDRSEVRSQIGGTLFGWTFRRAWCYWTATCTEKGEPIPADVANRVNDLGWGAALRVDGFAGGRHATEPVRSYHIDTQDALSAFSAMLHRRGHKAPESEGAAE